MDEVQINPMKHDNSSGYTIKDSNFSSQNPSTSDSSVEAVWHYESFLYPWLNADAFTFV